MIISQRMVSLTTSTAQRGGFRRLPQGDFLGGKKADGQMQRGAGRRQVALKRRGQGDFHGGKNSG